MPFWSQDFALVLSLRDDAWRSGLKKSLTISSQNFGRYTAEKLENKIARKMDFILIARRVPRAWREKTDWSKYLTLRMEEAIFDNTIMMKQTPLVSLCTLLISFRLKQCIHFQEKLPKTHNSQSCHVSFIKNFIAMKPHDLTG